MTTALALFHPVVAEWFAARFQAPTLPQEQGWPAIKSGRDTLIAAPTGSGKTLAAFLSCIDSLVRQGLGGELPDETQVVYISPLKALSNDIQKNLSQPLEEIRRALQERGLAAPEIRVLVRTGDTPAAQRQAMIKKPPHILVTTPESFYILLTSERGREMLKKARSVIVDEIHALARDKRGSHLSLSLERLDALSGRRLVRIGLSATQKPIEEVARFLVGSGRIAADGTPDCAIINQGHIRKMDLALELPQTPLEAVASLEQWEEIYDRLTELIKGRRTTLIFVNTRRLAERVAFNLGKRLGEGHITSHHGSLSKEQRLQAETRLKAGELKALVATASLELGIDIGTVDLVCQLGSTRSIASFLQRAGRSGHTVGAVPQGRLFPVTRDDLVECAALLAAVRAGELDRLSVPEKPLDILAQQIVAAVASEEWEEDALFALAKGAYPFRDLERAEFDQVVLMLAEGFATSRGRSGAYLHADGINQRLRGRRGARLAAVTSGGAIPETADYQVILEPQGTLVGTLNEDFAIESMAGDIFQLGISSWKILRVEAGRVRVEDAHGQPPTIPFWVGEAPARTAELSAKVSWLREAVAERLDEPEKALGWLANDLALGRPAAEQIVEYLGASLSALGVMPSQTTIVLERFFDESGGMQLVLHAPFGGRINRAWGLSLRKRFCRAFNFELQAAASDDAVVLSLGPQHSFPLEDVFSYLHSASVEDILVQALLAAPMFQTRWRWNATRSLAVLRQQKGKKVPAPLQRMRSDDLLAAAFPQQAACAENVVGDIEIPDHPLVRQTVTDCLTEAMDLKGLLEILNSLEQGRLKLVAKDTTEPSPLAHEILSAKPYTFLDDAPLEERRTQAVMTRRSMDARSAGDIGALDPEAIALALEQAWPDVDNRDELHDSLVLLGYLTEMEGVPWTSYLEELMAERRATRLTLPGTAQALWIAAERLPLFEAIFGILSISPVIDTPARERARQWTEDTALVELIRGRLEGLGPVTESALGAPLGLPQTRTQTALAALESEGFAMRGHFSPGIEALEWCDRRLLARIHRYTLDRLRKQIEPASAAEFIRFLFVWQRAHPEHRMQGAAGLAEVLGILQGFEGPAGAWEEHLLTVRTERYSPALLDHLSLSGQVMWGRLSRGEHTRRSGPTRASPITFLLREQAHLWLSAAGEEPAAAGHRLSPLARTLGEHLERHGASFFVELLQATRRLPTEVRGALGELVSDGRITGDGFGNLRGLIKGNGSKTHARRGSLHGAPSGAPETGGRWSLLRKNGAEVITEDATAELVARQLLRRYGVMFHRLSLRESGLPPWRDLLRVYRRLEARGEIRGGRFVSGFSGEQYALPEAVEGLRGVRRKGPDGVLVSVSGVDPLNLVGIITPGERVPAIATNRIAYRDGVPVAARVAGVGRHLAAAPEGERPAVLAALRR